MTRAAPWLLGAMCMGLVVPRGARAEEAPAIRLGGHAGLVIFDEARDLTTEDAFAQPGPTAILGVQARLAPSWLLVEIEASVGAILGTFDDDSSLAGATARLELWYAFLEGDVRPFVALGPTVTAALTGDYGNDVDLGFCAGGGVMIALAADWAVRADARWMLGDGVAGAADDLLFTLGADYAFR